MPIDISSYLLTSLADRPHLLALSKGEMLSCLREFSQCTLFGALLTQLILVGLSYDQPCARQLPKAISLLWFAGALFITSALSSAMPLYVSVLVVAVWIYYRLGRLLALNYEYLIRAPAVAFKDWRQRSPCARFAGLVIILLPFTEQGRRQILRLAAVLTATYAAFHVSELPNDGRAFSVSAGEVGSVAVLLVLSTRCGAALVRPLLRRVYRKYCRRIDKEAVAVSLVPGT